MLWGWTLIIGLTLFFSRLGIAPWGLWMLLLHWVGARGDLVGPRGSVEAPRGAWSLLGSHHPSRCSSSDASPMPRTPSRRGSPILAEPGDFRKGPEAVVHPPCTSPGAGRRWDLPIPLVPVSSLAVGPKTGSTSPIAGFSSSLCSLCRLLAPGYTETHYTTDGQPVTVAPNHTVGARDGRPSSQNKGDDGFGVSQSLSFTTRIPGVPFQRCVPRVGGPSMSQAGPPELAASWLHPSSCPEGCWL